MSTPRRIRLLPEHLIDQIKAGEVIERPANVLKELVENALDAGSTRIDVEIRDNGLTLLRVSDDGVGISPGDLEMAFGRHATSKIERFEDIYRLDTFGFRGEALPSIASISRLECVSWTQDSPEGASLRFDGGLSQGVFTATKSGVPHGTVMTIKDLFFNTPVRLKFMQSTSAEKNWLKRFFYAFALAYPERSFSIQWDDGEKLLYPAAQDHVARVRQFFSPKVAATLEIKEAFRQWQGLSCRLLLVPSANHRPEGPLEQVLINRRPILEKGFQRIVLQVLEKYWPGELPTPLILLDVPGDQVDVNVHPNKTVVKFHQHGEIISLITATLRECLPEQSATSELPLQSPILPDAPRGDLSRDRLESYTHHMELLSPGDFVVPQASSLVWPGPYFLQQDLQRTYYVDGRAILGAWAQEKLKSLSDSVPLLVSHPLRNCALAPGVVERLQTAGFELDELEAKFWVIRAIPSWLKGLPLETGLQLVLRSLNVDDAQVADFAYESLSPGKWQEVWEQLSIPEMLREGQLIELSPALFRQARK